MSEENLPVIIKASELKVELPAPSDLLSARDAEATRKAILSGGAFTQDGQTLIERRKVKTVFATDSDGANEIISNLSDDDKFRDGNNLFVKTSALSTPLSERIQEPRDAYEILRLKDSEACLIALRNCPSMEVRRVIIEARNEREMPRIKAKVLKNSAFCISGAALEHNADVHHKERVADNPRKSVDPKNLVAANKPIHKKIHAEKAHSPKALKILAKKEGWPTPE